MDWKQKYVIKRLYEIIDSLEIIHSCILTCTGDAKKKCIKDFDNRCVEFIGLVDESKDFLGEMISETMISILTKMIRKIYPKRSIEEEEKWMAKSLITRREKLQLNNLN